MNSGVGAEPVPAGQGNLEGFSPKEMSTEEIRGAEGTKGCSRESDKTQLCHPTRSGFEPRAASSARSCKDSFEPVPAYNRNRKRNPSSTS